MNKIVTSLCMLLIATWTCAQTPPPSRLKYFGFAIVDCGLDDPNDTPVLSNYIAEVDTFSNIAQMCVEQHMDTVVARVNLMNSRCVKPILSVSKVFIYYKDTNGPGGANYDLYPNFQTRWDTFKTINAAALNAGQVEMIYVCDEPTWNGVTYNELNTICTTIKNDFPAIPLIFVEAYTVVDSLVVPPSVSWIGFDRYGVFDVSSDSSYLAQLATLESKRSTPQQKIMLVFDQQWNPGFWPAGTQPDTMRYVLEKYYDLALADTNVIGLTGFTWPGIAPGWLGTRQLPQSVLSKTAQIGKMIKANFNPCMTGIPGPYADAFEINIYPNPASDELHFELTGISEILSLSIYDSYGQLVKSCPLGAKIKLRAEEFSSGIYYYRVSNSRGKLSSGKFVKE